MNRVENAFAFGGEEPSLACLSLGLDFLSE